KRKGDARTRYLFPFPIFSPGAGQAAAPPPPVFSSFSEDEGTKDVAVPSCPPPAPAYQRDLARLPLISAPPAPAPPSTARLRRPRWLLSDAYSASSRGCSGLLAGRGGVGCRLFHGVVLLAADEALRGARRRLHCSELLRRTAAGAMEDRGRGPYTPMVVLRSMRSLLILNLICTYLGRCF
uniref:Uncharacterized protein n=1 Tax=Aegilops tauschii subsp. strangulata TaxID=200361 RepID=A0A453PU38_AEGTS